MSDRFHITEDGDKYDLSTHDGRMAAMADMRTILETEEGHDALERVRRVDPYPVLQFEPAKGGIGFYPRKQLLKAIGRKENNPEEWDLLHRQFHPEGTVFMVLFWGNQHSYDRVVLIPKGLPEHN